MLCITATIVAILTILISLDMVQVKAIDHEEVAVAIVPHLDEIDPPLDEIATSAPLEPNLTV